jgi:GntR family transcriptional regulator, transcriptional repressor for pyruvate dehydrogenase complex
VASKPTAGTSRPDTSKEIAYAIRRAVAAQGLRPGDRIGTEQQLATAYGVSRPTVREALRLLAGAHLVRASQGRGGGIFVDSTPDEGIGRNLSDSIGMLLSTEGVSLHDLLEARVVLEVPLAGLAARNATAETVSQLEAAIAVQEGAVAGDETFSAADSRFHQTIAKAAGNDLLVAFTRWILDVLLPHLIAYIGPALAGEDIIAQHRAILRAIRRGQPAAAERAMRDHLGHLATVLATLEADRS